MTPIILVGNGVSASILARYLAMDNRYDVVGATVDDGFENAGLLRDIQTVPLSRVLTAFPPDRVGVVMAMGYGNMNRNRESVFSRMKALGYRMERYVHPDARVYTDAIGEACVVLPGAVIEPMASVGANTVVWANATLAHGATVGDHCWVASGAVVSGDATIRRNAFLGVNCTVVNKVVVDEYCLIGAGALVSRNAGRSSVHLARSGEKHRFESGDYVKFFGDQ